MTSRFPVLAIEARAEQADELAGLLFELGAVGIEQRDDETHPDGTCRLALEEHEGSGSRPDDSTAERAAAWPPARLLVPYDDVETPAGELRSLEARASTAPAAPDPSDPARVVLLASFESSSAAQEAREALARTAPEARCRLVELWGDEWRDRYRRAFAPFDLTSRLTIVPCWLEPPRPRDGDQRVVILDPGRAFGTGLHATTALVAAMVEERAAELDGCPLLDVGTGSGILGICALRLGASRVVAIDSDPEAVAAAKANARHNGLSAAMTVSETPVDRLEGRFPWVLANIEQRVLCSLADALRARVAPGGTLVLSGILDPQLDALLAAFDVGRRLDGARFELVGKRTREVDRDRWVAVALARAGES